MTTLTPPPLFNIMSDGFSKTLTFTPVSADTAAGPHGTTDRISVYTPSAPDIQGRYDQKYKSYKLAWWGEGSIIQHNALLMSAFYGMKWWDFRDHFKIPRKNFTLVADSGGFQQNTTGERIDPVAVLKWQEMNADIGFILDIPPKDPVTGIATKDLNHLTKCAVQTALNAERALRNRKNEDMLLYGILQGGDPEQFKIWIKEFDSRELEFDGYCASLQPPSDPMQVALHTTFLHNYGIKKVHIFGGTGADVTPVIIYAAKLFDLFTFDSSSYAVGSKFRKYFLPNLTMRDSIHFATKSEGATKIKNLPCDCPVCQISSVKHMFSDGSVPGALISLHNLYIYIRFLNMLTYLSDDDDAYLEYVTKYSTKETIRALNFIKDYTEIGYEEVNKKYFKKKKSLTEMFG